MNQEDFNYYFIDLIKSMTNFVYFFWCYLILKMLICFFLSMRILRRRPRMLANHSRAVSKIFSGSLINGLECFKLNVFFLIFLHLLFVVI